MARRGESFDLGDEEDHPSRRHRAKSGTPTWVWVIVGAGGLALVGTVLVCGGLVWFGAKTGENVNKAVEEATEVNKPPAGVVPLTDANAGEFMDHPDRFKGKTIQARLRAETPRSFPATMTYDEWRNAGLRGWAGQDIEFWGMFGNTSVKIIAFVPKDLPDLPRSQAPDALVLRFVCQEGRVTSGNKVVSVERSVR